MGGQAATARRTRPMKRPRRQRSGSESTRHTGSFETACIFVHTFTESTKIAALQMFVDNHIGTCFHGSQPCLESCCWFKLWFNNMFLFLIVLQRPYAAHPKFDSNGTRLGSPKFPLPDRIEMQDGAGKAYVEMPVSGSRLLLRYCLNKGRFLFSLPDTSGDSGSSVYLICLLLACCAPEDQFLQTR